MQNCIVVFLANVYKWGAERSVCSLCCGLQAHGYKVLVVIPHKGPVTELLDESSIEYIVHSYSVAHYHQGHFPRFDKYIRRLIKKPLDVWMIIREMRRRNYQPMLIYSASLPVDTGIICARILGIPHIQHIRENMDAFGYKFLLGKRITLTHLNNHSSLIICTCNAIKNIYTEYLDDAKTIVINNGVRELPDVKEKVVNSIINIVQVARLMPDKRVGDTLYAAKSLIDQNISNFKIDIYGIGPEEESLNNYIQSNDLQRYVELKGFKEDLDLSPYLIGLMTSQYEAFARSVLDYMNNGLAVIASDSGGNVEQVVDGKTGLLYRVQNVESLAEKLRTLILDPQKAKDMGVEGRAFFLSNFTQKIFQEKAVKAFQMVLDGKLD